VLRVFLCFKSRTNYSNTASSTPPTLICNLHGSDIIKFYHVRDDYSLSPDFERLNVPFVQHEWQVKQDAYKAVSKR
jgi:hypothetical protein